LHHGDLTWKAAEEALEVGLQAGGALLVVCAKEMLARVEWGHGDETMAQRQLVEALAAVEGGGVPASYVAAVELTLGRLLASKGDADGARVHLRASLSAATGVGDFWTAEKATTAISELL
jgi:ATP/maltotriose-dependent transcriptional regulator MalT